MGIQLTARRIGAVLVIGTGLAASSTATAAAAASTHSFVGSCAIQATATFKPAVNPFKPGPATLANSGSGTCTGTLDGTPIKGDAVTEQITALVYADGCLAAHTTAPGQGTLRFRSGATIRFLFEFSGVLTAYPITAQGQRSGSAHGRATFLTGRTQPDVAVGCSGLTGGLSQAPIDISLKTAGALVSGGPGQPVTTTTTFAGTCALSGGVAFTPPLMIAAGPGAVGATADGTCSGTLTDSFGQGQRIDAAPASLVANSSGTESCAVGLGSGTGMLTVASRSLTFTYDEVRAGPALVLNASGARGGFAVAQANVSLSSNPLTIVHSCAGSGLTQVPIDIRIVTPGISG
jgi:hypothetical protein